MSDNAPKPYVVSEHPVLPMADGNTLDMEIRQLVYSLVGTHYVRDLRIEEVAEDEIWFKFRQNAHGNPGHVIEGRVQGYDNTGLNTVLLDTEPHDCEDNGCDNVGF